MIGIYKITNPVGEVYIGQSTNIKKRFENYVSKNNNRQKTLFESFLKYGTDNHQFEVIEECNSDVLSDREKYWIKYYDSYEKGLNGNKGGGGVLKHSIETRNKISKTKLDNPRITTDDLINKCRNTSSLKKIVYQYDLEGNFIKEYSSINEASRQLGVKNDNISLCIRKKQNTGHNFQWFDIFYEKVPPITKGKKPETWLGNRNTTIDTFIDEINIKYKSGYSISRLSKEYNVDRSVIKKRLIKQ